MHGYLKILRHPKASPVAITLNFCEKSAHFTPIPLKH
jgi:hypothetical protein